MQHLSPFSLPPILRPASGARTLPDFRDEPTLVDPPLPAASLGRLREEVLRPGSLEIPIEVEAFEEPAVALDVALAPLSESNLVVGIDGHVRGVFVATYEDLPLGARLALSLHLPGGLTLALAGTVEWQRPLGAADDVPGLGVRFDALEPGDAQVLGTFATYRDPLFHDEC